MLLKGKHYLEEDELLEEYSFQKLWEDLQSPIDEQLRLVSQYRILEETFPDRAKEVKRDIPYFVFSELNPRKYKTGRLVKIESFCIEIHNFPRCEQELGQWREKILEDGRIQMMFLSVDKRTMYVFFKLRIPCTNETKFRLFYRNFTKHFFEKHEIDEEILGDACSPRKKIFISVDPEAYYCIGWKLVVFEDYLYDEWEDVKKEKPLSRKAKDSEVLCDEKLENIKKILKKKNTVGKQRSSNELLRRFDLNISILKTSLERIEYKLENVSNNRGGKRITVQKGDMKSVFNLVVDFQGNYSIFHAVDNLHKNVSQEVLDVLNSYISNISE